MAKKIRKTGAMGAEISVAPDAKKAIKEATQSAEKLTKEAKQTTASTHATTKNIEASVIQESRLRRELEAVANVEAKINRLLALRQKYLYPNGGIFPHPRGNAPLTPAERQARSRAYRRGAAVNTPKQAYSREPYNVNSTADPYASSRLAFERWRNTRRMLTNVGEAEARKLAMRNMRNALPAGMQNMAASMARELGAETAKYRQGYLGSIKNNADLIRLRASLPKGMKRMAESTIYLNTPEARALRQEYQRNLKARAEQLRRDSFARQGYIGASLPGVVPDLDRDEMKATAGASVSRWWDALRRRTGNKLLDPLFQAYFGDRQFTLDRHEQRLFGKGFHLADVVNPRTMERLPDKEVGLYWYRSLRRAGVKFNPFDNIRFGHRGWLKHAIERHYQKQDVWLAKQVNGRYTSIFDDKNFLKLTQDPVVAKMGALDWNYRYDRIYGDKRYNGLGALDDMDARNAALFRMLRRNGVDVARHFKHFRNQRIRQSVKNFFAQSAKYVGLGGASAFLGPTLAPMLAPIMPLFSYFQSQGGALWDAYKEKNNITSWTGGIKNIAGGIKNFAGGAFKGIFTLLSPLGNFFKRLFRGGGLFGFLGIGALVAGLRQCVSLSSELEQGWIRVRAAIGRGAASAETLSEYQRRVSLATGVTPQMYQTAMTQYMLIDRQTNETTASKRLEDIYFPLMRTMGLDSEAYQTSFINAVKGSVELTGGGGRAAENRWANLYAGLWSTGAFKNKEQLVQAFANVPRLIGGYSEFSAPEDILATVAALATPHGGKGGTDVTAIQALYAAFDKGKNIDNAARLISKMSGGKKVYKNAQDMLKQEGLIGSLKLLKALEEKIGDKHPEYTMKEMIGYETGKISNRELQALERLYETYHRDFLNIVETNTAAIKQYEDTFEYRWSQIEATITDIKQTVGKILLDWVEEYFPILKGSGEKVAGWFRDNENYIKEWLTKKTDTLVAWIGQLKDWFEKEWPTLSKAYSETLSELKLSIDAIYSIFTNNRVLAWLAGISGDMQDKKNEKQQKNVKEKQDAGEWIEDENIDNKNLPRRARGGWTNGLTLAGEAGREAVISFDRLVRDKNIRLWNEAGAALGVSSGVNLAFSPTINISGNADEGVIAAALNSYKQTLVDELTSALKRREYGSLV